jgi:hypothetical protein
VAKLEAVFVAKRSFVEVSPAAARGVKALDRVSGVRRKRMNESAKRRDMVIIEKVGSEQSSLRGEVLRQTKQSPGSPSVPYRQQLASAVFHLGSSPSESRAKVLLFSIARGRCGDREGQ